MIHLLVTYSKDNDYCKVFSNQYSVYDGLKLKTDYWILNTFYLEPGASQLRTERPGNRGENDDERDEIIPEHLFSIA